MTRVGPQRKKKCFKSSRLKIEPVFKIRANKSTIFLISNFRLVVNVLFSLLGDSSESEFYMPTFRNTLPVPSS